MSNDLAEYRDTVWSKWSREAAWPPGADLTPGMVGSIDLGAFVYEGALDDPRYGIAFEPLPDERATDEDLQSQTGISIKTKLSGTTDEAAFPGVPKAKAGFRADFARAGSFVFRANGMRYVRLKEQERIWDEVWKAMNDGRMSPDSVIVSEVAVADRGTIIIAADRGSSIVLTGDAEVQKGLDFGGRIEVASYDRLFERVVGDAGLTVVYLLLRPRASASVDSASNIDAPFSLETVRADSVKVEALPEAIKRYAGGQPEIDDAGSGYGGGKSIPD